MNQIKGDVKKVRNAKSKKNNGIVVPKDFIIPEKRKKKSQFCDFFSL